MVDDVAGAARDTAASCIAWYVCAMGDVYARSLTAQGYGAEVEAIRAANPRPSPSSGRVPGEGEAVLSQLTATGTGGQVRAQLERWDDGADIVVIGLPPRIPWQVIETTLRAAAPEAPISDHPTLVTTTSP